MASGRNLTATDSHKLIKKLMTMEEVSELSETEKRKLLRDRRKQKFSNGGASSRLTKITNQPSGGVMSTETFLEDELPSSTSKSDQSVIPNVEESTKEMDTLLANVGKPAETRSTKTNPEVALLQQLMGMQEEFRVPKDDNTPDLFSQMLNQSAKTQTMRSPDADLVDQSKVTMHTYQARKLKAYTYLIRWLLLLPLVYHMMLPTPSTLPLISSLTRFFVDKPNFFMIFSTFEVISISIYYQALLKLERTNKVNTLSNTSKIVTWAGLVPEGVLPISNIPRKIMLAMHYWDILSMYLTDLSFCLIIAGLLGYYNAL
ncbi:GET complex subunit GET2 Ecym_7464 [Eremothecium cymbalariae DBVPG|uniref:Golgi to ER traffic protein 2 n=1 Tax=Eremothecium cymbalariae (strain CBS 270.75 / DBVPG 7215 / KCTC 17166 / NRRL Y-17582) TaxID=931890 RepID=G8JWR8_ERECY|nr:hypothetical protein Ecym_7464 [Eremothecium cymbalariae DBVPG\